ncbi:MAG: hypothetical protein AAFQ09_01860 [Pseudomonadota bacterium]
MGSFLLRFSLTVLLVWVMAACGSGGAPGSDNAPSSDDSDGGGDDGTPPDPPAPPSPLNIVTPEQRTAYYDLLLPNFSTVNSSATTGAATPFAAPAVTGSVTYDGYMQLIMGNATIAANVIGTTSVQVSFDGGPVTGSAGNFLGVTPDEAMVRQVVAYEGTVDIFGGGVTEGQDGSTDISFQIDGALDNGVNTFAIDGTLVGGFYGSEAEGLYVIGSNTGVHGNINIAIDGASGTGTLGIGTVSAIKP